MSNFQDLCLSPCEIVIFKNMNHQYFDVTRCVAEPLADMFEKMKINFDECKTNIKFPNYLFQNPLSNETK